MEIKNKSKEYNTTKTSGIFLSVSRYFFALNIEEKY